jgi:hypothetical protein
VAAYSEAYACGLSLAGIAGSNPTGAVAVCLLCVLCVFRERSLSWANPLSMGVPPTVHVCVCVWGGGVVCVSVCH